MRMIGVPPPWCSPTHKLFPFMLTVRVAIRSTCVVAFESPNCAKPLRDSIAVRRGTRHACAVCVTDVRTETDSLGEVDVPADKLWGAQTQRSLEHFSIGPDLMPREMIHAYATLKKAAARANHDAKRLDQPRYELIVRACYEILAGQHHDMFPLHVWMT